MAKAQTTAQISVDFSTGELPVTSRMSYAKRREMRLQPTIRLVRSFDVAPIIAATWSVEGMENDHIHFVREQFMPLRTNLLTIGLFGESDFGWKAFEVVFGKREFQFPDGRRQKLTMIERVKPLKNDNTFARYSRDDGTFLGFSHTDAMTGSKVLIDAEHSLFINFDDEGLGDYGMSNLEVVEGTYDEWIDANDIAAKYDRKMAGTFLIVEFPTGKTPYAARNGEATDNSIIANDVAKALTSSGMVTIPKDMQQFDSSLPKEVSGWKIYFLDPQGRQGQFVERQKYLDAMICRAYAVAERSVLEGEFGTKAEAGIHGNYSLLIRQLHHERITEYLNQSFVNRLLEQNFGVQGTAWLKAMPLDSERMAIFRDIFTALMSDAGAGPEIADSIDLQSLADTLGVPLKAPEPGETTTILRPMDANGRPDGTPKTTTISIGVA